MLTIADVDADKLMSSCPSCDLYCAMAQNLEMEVYGLARWPYLYQRLKEVTAELTILFECKCGATWAVIETMRVA